MADSADRVVVELIARNEKFDADVRRSERSFSSAMNTIDQSSKRAENAVVRSTGQIGQSTRNLGYQISDIGTQLAGGQNQFLILAQQGPQVANALDGAGGAAGRLASFFSGPWGAALLAAASVVGVLVSKSNEAADAQGRHAEAAKTLEQAIGDLNIALGKAVQSEQQIQVAAFNSATSLRQQAIDARNATGAMIDLARAKLSVDRTRSAGPGQRGELGALAAGEDVSRLNGLDALAARNDAALATAQKNVRLAAIPLLQRQVAAETDKAAAATQKFTRQQDRLNAALANGTIRGPQYRQELAAATRQLQADTEAANKHDGATKRRTASTNGNSVALRSIAAAAREAAAAQRELQQTLESLQDKYDPAASAARKYRDELQQIANLRDKGAIGTADFVDLTMRVNSAEAKRQTKARSEEFKDLLKNDNGLTLEQQAEVAGNAEDARFQTERDIDERLQRKRQDDMRQLSGLYEDLFTGGTKSLWDDFKRLGIKAISDILAQQTLSGFSGLFGGSSGFVEGDGIPQKPGPFDSVKGGGILGLLGGLFGRASGGPVEGGRLYRVNEAGGRAVEGFMPTGSGRVIPLGSMPAATAGGGGTTVLQTVSVDARGAVMNDQFAQLILERAGQQARAISSASSARTLNATPGRLQQSQTLGS